MPTSLDSVAARQYGYEGGESKEAIRQLAEEGVIDGATAETLVAAVGFRNVLAHRYGDIDYSEVYELLQNGLAVYDEFGRQVAAWFKERG